MRDAGHRTVEKAKIIYPPPRGVDIINVHLIRHSGSNSSSDVDMNMQYDFYKHIFDKLTKLI